MRARPSLPARMTRASAPFPRSRADPAGAAMPTIGQALFVLTLVAALGCGLVAGGFFAFSSVVMRALARRPIAEGMAAMQSINIVVLGSWFIATFLGTAVVCGLALVICLLRWNDPGSAWLLAGSLLYLVGSLGVTIAFNVPRNEALARAAPASLKGAKLWA